MSFLKIQFLLASFLLLNGCLYDDPIEQAVQEDINYVVDFQAVNSDSTVNVVIEITAGTTEKWEVEKTSGRIIRDQEKHRPRSIRYLGYPCNYGMIPQTLLPTEKGGDGDPLDALVLGEPLEKGSVAVVKIIGVMLLLDRGEQDDKLICVQIPSLFDDVDDLAELNDRYPGITAILSTWFQQYKGSDKMQFLGYGDKATAEHIVFTGVKSFREQELSQ